MGAVSNEYSKRFHQELNYLPLVERCKQRTLIAPLSVPETEPHENTLTSSTPFNNSSRQCKWQWRLVTWLAQSYLRYAMIQTNE